MAAFGIEPELLFSIGLALCALGLLDSLYFVLVSYRVIRADPKWLPPVCRMDEQTCGSVIDTKYARLFGIPNAVYGVAWYALAGAAIVLELLGRPLLECSTLFLGALGVLAYSLWLAYALLARLKTVCVLCFLAHATNLSVAVALALACAG